MTFVNSAREFRVVNASFVVSIAPVFAKDPLAGVAELLDSMVMRYIPALQGVMLAHSNIQFLTKTATIKGDCPFAICEVAFEATVWSPQIGMSLVGRINLCSPDHVSLLVHRTFNVSIPRHHMPTDHWEFEYGPAENDPEFAPDSDGAAEVGGEEANGHGGGKWMHKITGDRLGGPDGFLTFTIIGLTVANEMLSLLGSIQEDPFSPEHIPETGVPSRAASGHDEGEEEESSAVKIAWEQEHEVGELEEEEESASQALKRVRDEATRAAKEKRKRKRARESSKSDAKRIDGESKEKKARKLKRT